MIDRREFLREGGRAGIAATWVPAAFTGPGRRGSVLDVRAFGAVGDGQTDDTAALGRALAALAERGGVLLVSPGAYRVTGPVGLSSACGAAVLGYGATLVLEATARFGLELSGTLSGLTIEGLRISGTGEVGHDQCGIGTGLQPAPECRITDLRIRDCDIGGVVRGICLEVPGGSEPRTHRRISVEGNHVHDVVGTRSGQGYGVVLSACWYSRIAGNHLDRVQRHSIYASVCRGTVIEGNTIRRHREGFATEAHLSAVACARSSHTSIVRNLFEACADSALSVEPHETDSAVESRGISVTGNHFVGSVHRDVVVGSLDPDTAGPLTDVVVSENFFERHDDSNPCEFIRVLSGKRVRIAGNQFRSGGRYRRSFSCVVLSGVTRADHIDTVTIEGNTAVATAADSGSLALIELGPALSAAEQRVRAAANDLCFEGERRSLVRFEGAVTAVPIDVVQPARRIALKHAPIIRTPADRSCYFQIRLTENCECLVEAPECAVAGMTLRYEIVNAAPGVRARLRWSPVFRLARRFTPPGLGRRVAISFYFDGADWIETGRAEV